MKKKSILITLIITLLMNSIITIPINSIATVEDEKFTASEIPYNLSIIKAGHYTNMSTDNYAETDSSKSIYLDSEGRLWKIDKDKQELKQIIKTYRFSDIAVGKSHIIALDKDGYLWAWGSNAYGQLGNGTTSSSTEPVSIYPTKTFKSIACSNNASFAIDFDGKLYAWGSNKSGESQAHTSSTMTTMTETYDGSYWGVATQRNTIEIQTTPFNILEENRFNKVIASRDSVIAIDSEGYAWGWGYNYYGHVGNYSSNTTKSYSTSALSSSEYKYLKDAMKISTSKIFQDASIGYNHSAFIDEEGKVYTMGSCEQGALGNGSSSGEVHILTQPSYTEDIVFKDVIAGYKFTGFIDENNNVWMCGNNALGYIGNGTTTDTATIVRVKVDGITFVNFLNDTASRSIHVLDSNGNLWGWGLPKELLADATPDGRVKTSPIQITGKLNEYTVTFKDGDTVLDTQTVTSGGSATAPTAPTKPGYTFAGWDKDFTNVTSDLEVKAKWTQNKYTVTFKNGDTVLDTQEIVHGGSATAPDAPEKVGHTFTGWDKDFTNVTSDLEVNAKWTVNTYTVTLNTNGGTIPEGQNVTRYTYGVGATLPTPTRVGYTFAGWYRTEDLTGDAINTIGTEATGDKTYFAKWEEGEGTAYKVEHYKQNPETNAYEKVATDDLTAKTGLTVTATPKTYEGYHENRSHEDRVASGAVAADGSLVLRLYYDINQYTVTFKNEDTVLKEETVAHGQAAVAPETPVREGYTFTGWDKDFSNVTSNLEVKAIWTVSTYKVTLETNGGTITEGENVTNYTYGVGATLPTPTREGYTFAGWYRTEDLTGDAITNIGTLATGDKTYYAKWNKNQYTVTFVSDGQTLSTQNIAHGENAIAPANPTKEGYTFTGWDKDFTNVTSNLEVKAIWTKNQEEPKQVGYKVEHYKQNTKTNSYEKVATEELTGTPGSTVTAVAKTYEGFHENTSNGDRVASGVIAEDGSLVLKLYYDINQYKVTFKDGDKVVKEETVAHGGSATPPIITKPGYILSWDKSTDNITGDTTFTAVWTKDPNYVDPNDGKEEKPSFLPQTGESYIVVGMISVVMSVAILVYLKYRKIGE